MAGEQIVALQFYHSQYNLTKKCYMQLIAMILVTEKNSGIYS